MDNFELVYELNRAVNTLNSYIDATIARRSGLTRAQCVALLRIARSPNLSRADLARELNCSHVAVRRLVAILADEGYVSCTPSEQNVHIIRLQATDVGKMMIERVQEVFQRQSKPLFTHAQTKIDLNTLAKELHTFTEILAAHKEEHRKARLQTNTSPTPEAPTR